MRQARGGAAVTAALVALVVVLAATTEAPGAEAKIACKKAGVHYVGKTTQKKVICLTVARDGSKLAELRFGWSGTCQGSGIGFDDDLNAFFAVAVRSGTFSVRWSSSNTSGSLKGTIRGAAASGTLTAKGAFSNPETGDYEGCPTGVVHWTARRAG